MIRNTLCRHAEQHTFQEENMKKNKLKIVAASLAVMLCLGAVPDGYHQLKGTAAQAADTTSAGAPTLIQEAPPCIFGDLNSDSRINAQDLSLLKQHILKKKAYSAPADLDGDGVVDSDDAVQMLEYLLAERCIFTVLSKYDRDRDGLSDYVEACLGLTDLSCADTDGDGLTDYEEICKVGSDPAKADSVTSGTSDPDADADGDGLTNLEEVKLGSDPTSDDSDGDGLKDVEEKKLKTSLTKPDTDGDGLTDYEEIRLGLDPLKTATDGTPDSARVFTQMIASDDPILSEINTEDNAYELSVEIKASGYAPHCLTVKESRYSYIMKDGSAVGIAPELSYAPEHKVESITLRFAVKEVLRDNILHCFSCLPGETYEISPELDGIRRFNVFKYFESINSAVPVYTEIDEENSAVLVTLDSFETDDDGRAYGIGSYSLVDLEVWGSIMDEPEETSVESAAKPALPRSGVQSDLIDAIKKTVQDLSEIVKEAIHKSYARITGKDKEEEPAASGQTVSGPFGQRYARYDIPGLTWTQAEAFCRAKGGHLAVITSAAEEAVIDRMVAQGTLNSYWLGGRMKGDLLEWITGEKSYYANFAYNQPDHINVENYLMIYRLDNPVITRQSTKLMWNNIREDGSYPNEPFFGAQHFGFICEWGIGSPVLDDNGLNTAFSIGGCAPVTLNGGIRSDSGTDSDQDGIPDFDEVDHKAISRLGGSEGTVRVALKKIIQYGHDALNYTQNVKDAVVNKINSAIPNKPKDTTPVVSDPSSEDTDKDGYSDASDPDKLNPPEYLNGKYDFLNDQVYYLKANAVLDETRLNWSSGDESLTTAPSDGTEHQRFRFVWDMKGYKILSEDGTKALTVVEADGSYTVRMQTYKGYAAQKWEVLPYYDEDTNESGFVLRSRMTSAKGKSLYLNYQNGSNITAVTKISRYCRLNLASIAGWYRFGDLYMQMMGWTNCVVSYDDLSRAFRNYRDNCNSKYAHFTTDYLVSHHSVSGLQILAFQNGEYFKHLKYADAPMNEVICEVLGTYNALRIASGNNRSIDFFRLVTEFELSGIRTNYLSGLISSENLNLSFELAQAEWFLIKYALIKYSDPFAIVEMPEFETLTSSFADDGGWGSDPDKIGYCLQAYQINYKAIPLPTSFNDVSKIYNDVLARNQMDAALKDSSAKCGILSECFGPLNLQIHTFALDYDSANDEILSYNNNCWGYDAANHFDNRVLHHASIYDLLGTDYHYFYGYVLY